MLSGYQGETGVSRKICITCAELIPDRAKRCNKCNSYQNWRRYFDYSSTVLALLTALVSVTTFALPVIKQSVFGENSEILSVFHGFDNDSFIMIATNQGTRPGTIGAAAFSYRHAQTGSGSGYILKLTNAADDIFIEPGKSKLIRYQMMVFSLSETILDMIDTDNYECRISIDVIQFKSTIYKTDFTKNAESHDFRCRDLQFLSTVRQKAQNQRARNNNN